MVAKTKTDKMSKNVESNLNRSGRAKGVPNKATKKAREAFAAFVDANAEKMQEWLDAIANDPKHGPKVAFDCLMAVSEYHVPKLARTEHVGDKDAPISVMAITWGDGSH